MLVLNHPHASPRLVSGRRGTEIQLFNTGLLSLSYSGAPVLYIDLMFPPCYPSTIITVPIFGEVIKFSIGCKPCQNPRLALGLQHVSNIS